MPFFVPFAFYKNPSQECFVLFYMQREVMAEDEVKFIYVLSFFSLFYVESNNDTGNEDLILVLSVCSVLSLSLIILPSMLLAFNPLFSADSSKPCSYNTAFPLIKIAINHFCYAYSFTLFIYIQSTPF